jgi:hypothetical protein
VVKENMVLRTCLFDRLITTICDAEDQVVKAAIEFVHQEINFLIDPKIVISKLNEKREPWTLIRAFLHGVAYQKFFGGQKVMSGAYFACLGHINENYEIDDAIGSPITVVSSCELNKNSPDVRTPFVALVRSFMAGVKWSIENKEG